MRSHLLPLRQVDSRLLVLGLCLTSIAACCGVALISAWKWPLAGDVSLMRYVVLLMGAGRAPYSQIVDINLPGSYLLEFLAMHFLGWGAHGLRLYDGGLCLLLCVFAFLIGRGRKKDSWYSLAAGLFLVLLHLQDGVEQAGQRDFALTVLVFGALVLLLRAHTLTVGSVFLFEAVIGFSLTIKPTMIFFALLPVVAYAARDRAATSTKAVRLVIAGALGIAVPVVVMFGWLWHFGSVEAFVYDMKSIGIVHGGLGRKGLAFLVPHSVSPLSFLLLPWIVFVVLQRFQSDTRRTVLLGAMLCGFVSYLLQAKGFPYQRYPFLGCLLLLLFLDLAWAAREKGMALMVSMATLVLCSFWFAPRFARLVCSFDTVLPFQTALETALRREAEPGTIQCLDTYGGCVNALYDLRVVQATGYLYDCYLFTAPSEARAAYRAGFADQFWKAKPETVIMTNEGCFDPARTFDRLHAWPEFERAFKENYSLVSERRSDRSYKMWSRSEVPRSFRLYRLK